MEVLAVCHAMNNTMDAMIHVISELSGILTGPTETNWSLSAEYANILGKYVEKYISVPNDIYLLERG